MEKLLHQSAFFLTALGAINWGLVGLFEFNVVTSLLGPYPQIVQIVYLVIGVSAVYTFLTHTHDCKMCAQK